MSSSWGQFEENNKLRERVVVLEQRQEYLQKTIDALRTGQAENRAFMEKRFDDLDSRLTKAEGRLRDVETLIKASPVQHQDNRLLLRIMLVTGGSSLIVLFLFVIFWYWAASGGHLL